ncbi:unnamed protein product [Brachionus calyciflorus]|uniref:C-type lectin domain-containing protein n=1 Tax=Brachionus calyciflorus TaxID=104777 RepID=A0A813PQ80_9BILA|nr:unnamed protein product [Brachionus calyciflorus]
MSGDKSFTEIRAEISKKSEVWSKESENDKDLDYSKKQKINLKQLNNKEEHYLVNEYALKQDKFKLLNNNSKFKIPLWATILFTALGLVLLLGALAAILVSIFSSHNFLSYNSKCDNSTRFCDPVKNLKCVDGLCACANSNFYWSSSNTTCIYKHFYASSCSSTSECLESSGLYCAATASGCNCPATSVSNMCDCPITKLSVGSTCTFDKQCSQVDVPLVCTSNLCSCPSTHYNSNSNCVAKLGLDKTCSSDSQCDDSKLLKCLSSKCSCQTGYYYDSNLIKCSLLKSYGVSCLSNQCDSTKGLSCSGSICVCSSSAFWSSYNKDICPDNSWTAYQNTACLYLGGSKNQTEANTFCENNSASMCTAATTSDFELLQQFLASKNNADNLWMGVSKTSGTYKWQDGTSVSSSMWCSNSISNNCARLERKNGAYCLKDKQCSDNNKICCIKYN